jgi:hypothetical protein
MKLILLLALLLTLDACQNPSRLQAAQKAPSFGAVPEPGGPRAQTGALITFAAGAQARHAQGLSRLACSLL